MFGVKGLNERLMGEPEDGVDRSDGYELESAGAAEEARKENEGNRPIKFSSSDPFLSFYEVEIR